MSLMIYSARYVVRGAQMLRELAATPESATIKERKNERQNSTSVRARKPLFFPLTTLECTLSWNWWLTSWIFWWTISSRIHNYSFCYSLENYLTSSKVIIYQLCACSGTIYQMYELTNQFQYIVNQTSFKVSNDFGKKTGRSSPENTATKRVFSSAIICLKL